MGPAIRFAVVFTLLGATTIGYLEGLPVWVAIKIGVFAVLVACGIAVRFALKPFALAYMQMINEGASEAGDTAMIDHMSVVRRYVWVIWLGLFVNAALGLRVIGNQHPSLPNSLINGVTLAIGGHSLSPFGVSIMVPLVPLLSASMGHSVTDLQYLFSIYVIGLAVSQPIVGVITTETADDSYCCWDSQVIRRLERLAHFRRNTRGHDPAAFPSGRGGAWGLWSRARHYPG